MMWPVSLHPGASFVGHRDASYYMWLSWKLGQLISGGDIFSLRVPDVIVPYGSELLLMDGPLPSLVGGVWNLVANPFLAFNLTLLTGTLLNMWAGRRLGRLFSDSRGVWIVTALAFATAPAIVLRMFVHLPMYFAFAVPLLLEQAVRIVRDGRPLEPIRIGFLLFLAYVCSIYFLLFGGLALALFVLIGAAGRDVLLRRMGRLLLAGAIAFVLMLPFSITRVMRDREEAAAGGRPVLIRDSFRASADVLSIVAQPAPTTLDLPGSDRLRRDFRKQAVHEATIFPGLLTLLGGVGAAALLPIALKRQILCTALTLWLLALGTSLKADGELLFTWSDKEPMAFLPYTLFFHVPGLGSLRASNRVSYTLAAVLALGLAASLGWLFEHRVRGQMRVYTACGLGAVLATNLLLPVPQTNMGITQSTSRALQEMSLRVHPGESAIVVPADCANDTLPDVKLQVVHQVPLVGCQASASSLPLYSGMDLYVNSAGLAALRCNQARLYSRVAPFKGSERFDPTDLEDLYEDFGLRFVILDKLLLAGKGCGRLRRDVSLLDRYEILGEDRRWLIVDTQQSP
jgi:hypothetical protein